MTEEKKREVIYVDGRGYDNGNGSAVPVVERLSRETEADDLFGFLVSKNEKEMRSAVAFLMRIFLLKKERKEAREYVNKILSIAGNTPQRREKIVNAIKAAGGQNLLHNLKNKGISL